MRRDFIANEKREKEEKDNGSDNKVLITKYLFFSLKIHLIVRLKKWMK